MTHTGFPPANYDPPTCVVVPAASGRKHSRWLLGLICTVIAIIVFAGLWLIGIPTASDLK